MAGIRIKSETGNEGGGWWVVFTGVFISLGVAGEILSWLDVRIPVADNMIVRVIEFLLFAAISYGLFTVIVLLSARVVTFAFLSVERAAYYFVATIEGLFTIAASRAMPFLTTILKLPFAPIRIGAAWAHTQFIAPALERRRQRAELRRLYEEVQGEYASFSDFLRQFEQGADTESEAAADTDAREGEDKVPEPTPVDKFVLACRTIGLSENGAFTQAELKTRFLELMKAIHPDVLGPNIFASQLNEAREIIKSRKGWK